MPLRDTAILAVAALGTSSVFNSEVAGNPIFDTFNNNIITSVEQIDNNYQTMGRSALEISLDLNGYFDFGFVNPLSEESIRNVITISNIDIDDNPNVGVYMFTVNTFVGDGDDQRSYLNATGAMSIISNGILSFQQLGGYESTINTNGTTVEGWTLNYFMNINGDDAISNLENLVNGDLGLGTGGANVDDLGQFGHTMDGFSSMTVTPTPSALSPLLLGGLLASRRRRTTANQNKVRAQTLET